MNKVLNKGLILVLSSFALFGCKGRSGTVIKTVEAISITEQNVTLELNKSIPLTISYTPIDAEKTLIVWSSDNPYVKVDENGVATGYALGSATIKAMVYNNYHIFATTTISVVNPAV